MVNSTRSTRQKSDARRHARNLFLIVVSLYVAFELYRTGAIEAWVLTASLHIIPGSFIAGIFFTSLFTLAPATIVLVEIAHVSDPFIVAAIAAAGAVLGDLFLFMFVRDSVSNNIPMLLNGTQRRHLKALLKHPLLHWLLPAVGALIIASPLPDELGLALMGFSRIKLAVFIPISYAMNFLGILAVALIGEAVL
ncbi:hypothetical protein A3A38_03610 [Candidatus Kaiserbacteria bacterium RIFCSPLOWO2_01_FULL_53_17]|uniref:Uncharacterized protein n=1 Tax=Candidatus Kaiserbacteria bacterium RIFCSPLOWO2_01_FULL_53_17 TaxID=1798511 RepID=A0A1F6EGE4_9BACT|nr:MAG: hypothetical protein A3A38_03610 [Candidatus Kaiserbacteria bacterium RIFCSPLOWO2_01_FULL_53_17]